MDYTWLKALHISAVTVWFGGLVLAAVTVHACAPARDAEGAPGRVDVLTAVRRWDGAVTSPAMGLVWLLGIVLAVRGEWFGAPWLTIKLVLVGALSALHGFLSGMLRRLVRADALPISPRLRHAPLAAIAGVIAIIMLVVLKPL